MALIITGKSGYAICGKVLQKGEALVATSPFISNKDHPLWRYSDAAMHKSCFLTWPERLFFINTFTEHFERHYRGMRFMLENGSIENRDPKPRFD